MRAVMDSRETVCEFRFDRQTYRLILRYGKQHFAVDILRPDEFRPWLYGWEPYAYGTFQGTYVSAAMTDEGHAVELGLLTALNDCLAYVDNGPSKRRIYNA